MLFKFLCVDEHSNAALLLLEMFEDSVALMEVRLTTHQLIAALHHNPLVCPPITLSYVHALAAIVYSHQI
jgi:hypothetical protein